MASPFERGHMVVLVASLNKFSYHSGAVSGRAIDLVDAFFQAMLPLVDSSGGTVFDFVGQQLLVNFHVSDDVSTPCAMAVEAALKMQQTFKLLEPGWQECGYQVEMGIGIHHGMVQIECEEHEHYQVNVISGKVVDVARSLAEQSGFMLVSEPTFQQIRSLQNRAFQSSKMWVSCIGDGIVAYRVTTQTKIQRFEQPAISECQILIAEDHTDLSNIFETVLRRAGYSVNIAKNGHEAMGFLERSLPSLLLLDINMPGPSGLEIIRYVRQSNKNIKIIVITANYQAGRSAEADMADLFLLKPVSITDLVQIAHRFMKA